MKINKLRIALKKAAKDKKSEANLHVKLIETLFDFLKNKGYITIEKKYNLKKRVDTVINGIQYVIRLYCINNVFKIYYSIGNTGYFYTCLI